MLTPKLSKSEALKMIQSAGINLAAEKIVILGVRGYYKNTFGRPGVNDRNFYDDAIFVVSEKDFAAYQGNVDPSISRSGVASLKPGIYTVVKHKHRGLYDALQIVDSVVTRDNRPGEFKGNFGINFHYGGNVNTGSLGCQTLPPSTYWFFLKKVYALMSKYQKTKIKYLFIEN